MTTMYCRRNRVIKTKEAQMAEEEEALGEGFEARLLHGPSARCPYTRMEHLRLADKWLEGFWQADAIVQRKGREVDVVIRAVVVAALVLPFLVWILKG